MKQFIWGALVMATWVAGVFFLRYWRETRDRLFIFFAMGFWAFGLSWLWLALVNAPSDTSHYGYVPRLVAFGLIIAGIVDKNRRAASRR